MHRLPTQSQGLLSFGAGWQPNTVRLARTVITFVGRIKHRKSAGTQDAVDHSLTLESLELIAGLEFGLENYVKAEKRYSELLKAYREQQKVDLFKLANCLQLLGSCERSLCKSEEAEQHLLEALAEYKGASIGNIALFPAWKDLLPGVVRSARLALIFCYYFSSKMDLFERNANEWLAENQKVAYSKTAAGRNDIGVVLVLLEQWEVADTSFSDGLKVAVADEAFVEKFLLVNLTLSKAKLGKFEEADAFARRAEQALLVSMKTEAKSDETPDTLLWAELAYN